MDDSIIHDVLDRLEAARGLPKQVSQFVLAALIDEVEKALGGGRLKRPRRILSSKVAPREAFVRSISVKGFRGIGSKSLLKLDPKPGLTLVVGRNGSGKSSFSEAFELLLTGDNTRWSMRRGRVWRDGWRNLHQPGAAHIEAEILTEGSEDITRIRHSWRPEDELEDGATMLLHRGRSSTSLEPLAWKEALATHRPFLSYHELGIMLDEGPTRLYDMLATVLGFEDFGDISRRLADIRKARSADHRKVKKEHGEICDKLREIDDERATQALDSLKGTRWQLEKIENLVTGGDVSPEGASDLENLRQIAHLEGPDVKAVMAASVRLRSAVAEVDKLRGTDAEKARRRASLLHQALELHELSGDTECPICGRGDSLDDDWHQQAIGVINDLRAQGDAADLSHLQYAEAEQRVRELLIPPPLILKAADAMGLSAKNVVGTWAHWLALRQETGLSLADGLIDRTPNLAKAVEALCEEAKAQLVERQDNWREAALQIAAWLPGARRLRDEKDLIKDLQMAEKWIRTTSDTMRAERFRPITDQAKAFWEVLRGQSHISLDDVSLEGTATRRRVNLDVTVDGAEGSALSVMSEGELNALALCLFLPRATLKVSPFRFLFIDDPVQAMDSSRVDSLAQVLRDVAKDRQVVVFTADDRLRDSVARLNFPVTTLEIERAAGSVLEVRKL